MDFDISSFSHSNLTRIAYYCDHIARDLYPPDLSETVPLFQLRAPATFFSSLGHVLLSLLITVVLFTYFNSVKVLGKKVYTSSTSSLWWVLFFSMHCCYSLAFLLFLPSYASGIELTAYCVLRALHIFTYFFLCGALDHEWRFRTTATASLTVHPYSLKSKLRNTFNYFINWSRALFFCQSMILLSIALIMPFKITDILYILVLIYSGALLLMQCTVLAIGLAVICKKKKVSRPRLAAKLILALGLFLQISDLFPVFFINGFLSKQSVCLMRFVTPYDLLSLVSIIPLLCYLVFIVMEYKRVEAMNKYNIVADLQALLQFQK